MYCKLLRLFWLINKINLLWFKLNETLSDISNKPFTFTSFLDVSEGQKETHWEGSGLPSCVHAAFSSCWSALGVCFHLQPDFISASHFICLMDPLNYRNGLFADTIQMCPEWFVCQQRFFFFFMPSASCAVSPAGSPSDAFAAQELIDLECVSRAQLFPES